MHEQITHTDSLCKHQESLLFISLCKSVAEIYTKRIITHRHILRFHSWQHRLHKGQSNWYISGLRVHTNDLSRTLIIIKWWNLLWWWLSSNYNRCSIAPLDGTSVSQCASRRWSQTAHTCQWVCVMEVNSLLASWMRPKNNSTEP